MRPSRIAVAACLVLAYVLSPFLLFDGPIDADNRSIRVLMDPRQRVGTQIAFDRDRVVNGREGTLLITRHGEELRLIGKDVPEGVISLQGYFIDERTISVTDFHLNRAGFRDLTTAIGLIFILAFSLITLAPTLRTPLSTLSNISRRKE